MSQTESQFAPRSIGEILDRAVVLYRRSFLAVLALSALVQVPVAVAAVALQVHIVGAIASGGRPMGLGETLAFFSPVIALSWLGEQVQQGLLVRAFAEKHVGGDPTALGACRQVLPRIGHILLAGAVVSVGLLFGAGMCFVPYLFFLFLFSMVMPAIVLEGRGAFDAISRSASLVTGSFFRIMWVIGGAFLLTAAGSLSFSLAGLGLGQWLTNDPELNALVEMSTRFVGSIMISPISAGTATVLYYDLRVRREGLDLEMALTADAAALAGQPPERPEDAQPQAT